MKKVLTIGDAMRDVFLEYKAGCPGILCATNEELPFIGFAEGAKIEVTDIKEYLGGGAANSAASFSLLGFNTTIFCKVGTDKDGEFIIRTLKEKTINTNVLIQSSKKFSGTSFILPCPSGNNSILAYRGINTTITKTEAEDVDITDYDLVYTTTLNGISAEIVPSIMARAKQANSTTAANPGLDQITNNKKAFISSLAYIDILTLNAQEACLLFSTLENRSLTIYRPKQTLNTPLLLADTPSTNRNTFDLQSFFKTIHKKGPKIVAVTNGKEGVYISDAKTLYFHPSVPLSSVSSVGAGDAFGSTLVSFLARNHSIENALLGGILNSASVIQQQGAQTGLLSLKKIEEQIGKISPSFIKIAL